MKHYHSTKQVAPGLGLELSPRMAARIHCHIAEGISTWLVDFLQAVDQRPPLYRDSSCVISDPRIRFNHLGYYLKLQLNDVSSRPPVANRKILSRRHSAQPLAIPAYMRVIGPARNTQEKSKLGSFRRRNS